PHELFEFGTNGLLELIERLLPQRWLFPHGRIIVVCAKSAEQPTIRHVFPRGLAIDLDGTLLGPDERVSPRNRAALIAARAGGLHIVIASARWFQVAQQVAAEIADGQNIVDGPAIACSGA